ncbi:hypothetical protein OG689_39530 [Kitasatospora sp. NBC_00240]|nr:hypothetical protein [Kitasatospora sp. NBC_00240]MCX5215279.1 hypothetical protein [Kitasatospora sp. NBC_00240]
MEREPRRHRPYTMGGDLSWSDYTVAGDTLLRGPGSVQLMARVGVQGRHPALFDAYYLGVSDTGAWSLVRSSKEDDGNAGDGSSTVLRSGSVPVLGTDTWHHLALTVDGPALTAAVDGNTVGSVTDTAFTTGMVGLGGDRYRNDQFDNLSVTPTGPPTAATGPLRLTDWGNKVVGCLDGNGTRRPRRDRGAHLGMRRQRGPELDRRHRPHGPRQRQVPGRLPRRRQRRLQDRPVGLPRRLEPGMDRLETERRELATLIATVDLTRNADRAELTTALEALHQHIAKEEDGLFPASLIALTAEDWDRAMAAWRAARAGHAPAR